jgi:hypothetical protein
MVATAQTHSLRRFSLDRVHKLRRDLRATKRKRRAAGGIACASSKRSSTPVHGLYDPDAGHRASSVAWINEVGQSEKTTSDRRCWLPCSVHRPIASPLVMPCGAQIIARASSTAFFVQGRSGLHACNGKRARQRWQSRSPVCTLIAAPLARCRNLPRPPGGHRNDAQVGTGRRHPTSSFRAAIAALIRDRAAQMPGPIRIKQAHEALNRVTIASRQIAGK